MLQPRAALKFSVLLVVYATLFLIPWQPVEQAYASLFRTGGNIFFTRFWFWGEGHTKFLDLHAKDLRMQVELAIPGQLPRSFQPARGEHKQDTLLLLSKGPKPPSFGQLHTSSRMVGYWPTVWLLALILAKPMSWKRRGKSLMWGMVLLHLFIAVRLSFYLAAKGFGVSGKVYALFAPGEFFSEVLTRGDEVFMQNPSLSFFAPTFIWFAVAFSRSEWAVLRKLTQGSDDENESD